MRHLLSLFLTTVIAIAPVLAQGPSKPPAKLGSLSDPDERADSRKDALPAVNAAEILDQDFPDLPQTLRWEIALAVRALSVSDTPRTRSDLLTAATKGVEILCLGELQRTLGSDTPSLEPDCVKLLDMVKGIDPDSPIVLCTRAGIDSEECHKAYLSQSTVSDIPTTLSKAFGEKQGGSFDHYAFQNDLAVRLDAEKAERAMRAIKMDIDKIRPKGKTPLTPEQIQQKDALIGKYLQSSCSLFRLVNFPKALAISATAKPPKKSGSATAAKKGSLEELLSAGPFKGATTGKTDRGVQNHFRLVSKQCISALEQAKKYNPHHPAIPCRTEGATSPACIQARRAFLKTLPKGTGAAIINNEGIEKF